MRLGLALPALNKVTTLKTSKALVKRVKCDGSADEIVAGHVEHGRQLIPRPGHLVVGADVVDDEGHEEPPGVEAGQDPISW